ncbi:MAG: molybdate ABC transporter substrate-binding protein [Gammaproteobacteria bacterium]
MSALPGIVQNHLYRPALELGVRRIALLALMCCIALAPLSSNADRALLVFGAASLREGMDAAAEGWRAAGNAEVRVAYASSSTLARQIEAGAEADVYVSASVAWMDYLDHRQHLREGSRRQLLGGRLVLVAPKGIPVNLSIGRGFDLAAALGGGHLAMGDPDHVPAGMYGREALIRLDVWHAVKSSVARADNVRAALALVARGEAPLGIVYSSDAAADPSVRVIDAFTTDTHTPIVYPGAVLNSSRHPDADRFMNYLTSDAALAQFERFGFSALR